MTLHHGDCLDVMAAMEPESVDAIVTDPPYGLGFMGKAWDAPHGPGGLGDVPMRRRAETNIVNPGVSRQGGRQRSTEDFARRQARDARSYQAWCEEWATECLRIAKPGAYLLAFGGTRTVHRLAAAIEDAGWELRDMLVWGYASGFPKSRNLRWDGEAWVRWEPGYPVERGTALKPAWEPVVMARKSLVGTVATNLTQHGTGALRIHDTRIGDAKVGYVQPEQDGYETGLHGDFLSQPGKRPFHYDDSRKGEPSASRRYADEPGDFAVLPGPRGGDVAGRWPANVVLTDPIFDGDVDGVVGGGWQKSTDAVGAWAPRGAFPIDNPAPTVYGDEGTYSRFFLIPKADRADREPVLGGQLAKSDLRTMGDGAGEWTKHGPGAIQRENVHPTVKPTDLMRHLVRLVTPAGGTVLDPFLGSGTTALAAEMEGFAWVGIEREAEYVAIAEARLNGTQRGLGLESA